MITDIEITFNKDSNEKNVAALAFVIEEDVVYTIPASELGTNLFLSFTDAVDVSEDFAENEGLTVKLINNGLDLETLNTSEYFGSILLSNPKVINLLNHKRGYAVIEPAKFIENEFYILDGRDDNSLDSWSLHSIRENGYECGGDLCGCKK